MKKVLIVLVIIAAVVFGGLKFNANKVEEKYNEALNLIKASGMEVKNSVFEGGLLKSHANYDVVLSKGYINEIISLGEEYGAPEDLAIKIDMNISHGFDSLLGKFEVAGDAEFLNDPYKNFIKEIFDTTRPIKFHADGASGGDKKFVFELVGVQKEQDGNKLNLAKSFLNFDLNGEKKITGATFVNDFIDFASKQGVAIKIKNIDYDVKYETPIEPKMISKALVNSTYKFELGGIDVISGAEALQIGKIASNSKLTVLSDTLTQDDTSTIEKIKYGKSRISGKVERTLARDYFKAYSSTYKTIIFAMLLSAMVMTLVLVSQSYRTVDEIYGKHKEQYNFQSQIFTDMQINKQLVSELYLLDEIDEIHVYEDKSFKFYLSDNKGFYSDELKNAFESGNKSAEDMYVNIIALHKQDFDKVIYINKLGKDAKYILLNKTPEKNNTPYSFRKYISLTNSDNKELVLRYNADEKKMPIHIDAYIKYFPFDLEAQNQKGIYVFTTMENLEKFIEEYGQDKADPTRYYNIKLKAKKNLDKVSDNCERIISS